MAKVDLELVKSILQKQQQLDVRTIGTIMEEIEEELKIQQEENPPAPRVKKQFALLVSDPEDVLPEKDLVGWVVQLPEEESPLTTEDRLTKAAFEFNQTPKGRRYPVKSIGEVCEAVPARILKEQNIWVKTKEPVILLKTRNRIPFEKLGD